MHGSEGAPVIAVREGSGAPAPGLLPLRRFLAPETVFGAGALEFAGQYASQLTRGRVLLVTDPRVREAGWAGKVEASLALSGLEIAVFDGVTSNTNTEEVERGVQRYQDEGCSLIVAVGGGSTLDCAKAIGMVAVNGGPVQRYEEVDTVPAPGPPLICVPTTAGSSSNSSPYVFITDRQERRELVIFSRLLIPDVALLDPRTTVTMSDRLTATTGLFSLGHAFEGYASTASSPITDLLALEAARSIARHLPAALRDPEDMAAREGMMLATMYAGLAFSNAGLGLANAMVHALSGATEATLEEGNAVLLEHAVRFNYAHAADRYGALERAVFGEATNAQGLAEKMRRFRVGLGIEGGLAGLGLRRKDIPELARNALRDPCLATNPRAVTQEDIEGLYERAL